MQFNIIKYGSIIEKARTSFWFIPSFMVLSSIVLAVFTVCIDALYIESIEFTIPLVYKMDIDAIRSLLATIAGAMITVTSIAFSLTIVALTLASSQFGPRLLRNFMMDTGTQVVLGAFISNFLFCILVFCAISFQEPYIFKPGLTVLIAVIMTCISVGVLIYFIHHVAKAIQADVVIDDVYQELQCSIDNLFPSISKQKKSSAIAQSCDKVLTQKVNQIDVLAKCSGYVQTIEHIALLALATENKALIECIYYPGDYIVEDSVIAIIHSDNAINKKTVKQVSDFILLGAYRTPVQDPEFAIHQLVEIALRALSPGINDPYTAITCVDKLNSVLCGLTKRVFPARQHYDEAGQLRLVCKVLTFDDIARAAFDQIRQEATNNVSVTIRLLNSLNNLILFANTNEQKNFVISQTKMIDEQQSKQPVAKADSKCIGFRIAKIFSSISE
ncbi:DUF2254 domain-containing protein [Colwellia sp. Bg11-12]|uniref:DUF2254 domain-containing protein n=1 Tax=Colwellia sp. Bg11-12 TaxID=2759817 RepID=UPI0015F6C5E5|nr:DUF2254 domain-containing protein [Colwellia sp. Bg11-12]MBA6265649.1 DUF2254 domain-containing protein [Colwellia sp. Bg11-12]